MDIHTNRAAVNWDEYARCYDALCTLKPYQTMLSDVLSALPVTDGMAILDAGCGTGNLTAAINTVAKVNIFALDNSEEMLRRAEKKYNDSNIQFVKKDLSTVLPFDDNIFDAITCTNVLYAVKDPKCLLRELRRVLKPKANLVLTTPKTGYENGLILKEHCSSKESDRFWSNMHQTQERERALLHKALRDTELESQFNMVVTWNRIISQSTKTQTYTEEELRNILQQCNFTVTQMTTTYAKQNLFVVATKM